MATEDSQTGCNVEIENNWELVGGFLERASAAPLRMPCFY
jgi:hypothetical protein